MRKFLPLAVILAVFSLSQATFAVDAADPPSSFGMPISAAVIVSFKDSSAVFKPDADQATRLADANGAALVTIRGRTSTNKPSAKDESLALSRALSARSYLIARGVSPLKVVINFASAADFISDNSTPEGRQENQRVEVEMVFVSPLTN
ncbi:OmpA family protein [Collimonas sp.]|jgi:outer membrane protein OmpA-like peptidoglycan-associated protein|uniref:OmpA family protein n=1 Tax=Collimonas sp. TaxID=1963772 RepID=UPI0037C0F475